MHLQRHRWLMFVPYALGPQGHFIHGTAHVLFVNSQYLVVRQSGSLSHSGTKNVEKIKIISHILIILSFKVLSFFSLIMLISGNITGKHFKQYFILEDCEHPAKIHQTAMLLNGTQETSAAT